MTFEGFTPAGGPRWWSVTYRYNDLNLHQAFIDDHPLIWWTEKATEQRAREKDATLIVLWWRELNPEELEILEEMYRHQGGQMNE